MKGSAGRATVAVGATVVVAAAAATLVTVQPFSDGGGSGPELAVTTTAGPPAVPEYGAYIGAWTKPENYSQQGRIEAVESLERDVGRRFDIVHTYRRWQQGFPSRSDMVFMRRGSMLLLSWGGTDTREIAAGRHDGVIRERARAIRATGKPIFLEWRWEMDRPNLRSEVHSPADYIAAWKHIRAIFEEERVTNVAWVWGPTAHGFQRWNAAAYYPGDEQVDWVCADVYPGRGTYNGFAEVAEPFLEWASDRPKPIMIGEYGVPLDYGGRRAQWLRDAADTAREHPQIKAMCYFDSNPKGHGPGRSYGLAGDVPALDAFREMATDPYFNPLGQPVQRA